MKSLLLALAVMAGIVLPGVASAQSVTVTGPGGHEALTLADVADLPRQTVSLTIHGETHAFSGPTLASVLGRVGAPLGEALRGPALASYVLVGAADGYRVVLSLAEVDPALSPTAVLLADQVDGDAIGAEDGPFRLVVEGDVRPARSARQVTSIELRAAD